MLQAQDNELLADARARHQLEEEQQKARRRADRAMRRAARTEDTRTSASGHYADVEEELTSAAERSQPASTSAPEITSNIIESASNARPSSSGRQSPRERVVRAKGVASVGRDLKLPTPAGARAMAAARTGSRASWGRVDLNENALLNNIVKAKPSKVVNAPHQAMKTAQKYLKVLASTAVWVCYWKLKDTCHACFGLNCWCCCFRCFCSSGVLR
jgi:hypothetical protein